MRASEDRLEHELIEAPGSSWLLVTFAGLHIGFAPPERWREDFLGDLPCHRMYVGHPPKLILGADSGEMRARLATLVSHTANRLGVPKSQIICQGHSFSGSAAVIIGTDVDAGWLFAGAPCVWLGSWAYRLANSSAESRVELFDYLFNISGLDRDLGRLRGLDHQIIRKLAAATDSRLRVFLSPSDTFYREGTWLANELALRKSQCEVSIIVGKYPDHESVQYEYYPYLIEQISRLVST